MSNLLKSHERIEFQFLSGNKSRNETTTAITIPVKVIFLGESVPLRLCARNMFDQSPIGDNGRRVRIDCYDDPLCPINDINSTTAKSPSQ